METSGWDIALAISTVVLAVATIVLAAAAIVAGVTAVRELSQTRKLADVDVRRRRAEVSTDALRRFMTLHDEQHPIMLAAARKVTAEREKTGAGTGLIVKRCRIPDLLTEDAITSHETSDAVLDALQCCLDGLEEIGLGVELGVYDKYVLYHGAFNRIHQLVEWSHPFIDLSRKGRIPHREAQHTAFAQVLALDARLLEIQAAGAPKRLAGALDEGSAATEPPAPTKSSKRRFGKSD